MAYKALYRTYRPNTFDEVSGQEHIITTLKNAIKENRISHAYLFAGPRGTGKTTVAKILAKALNCQSDNPPCGNCDSCNAITRGEHPDVIEIDAASNNGVDEVRDLIDKVKYAPIEGKYKVYIIDEVHMMTQGAFNALLKTLEEPPAHIVFVLATTEPHKILPTIISRCQRFDFKKVDDHDIINRLKYVLDSENKEYEEPALAIVAKLAEGGMRDALSILEQCLAYDDHLTVESVNKVYGLLSIDNMINFIKLLLAKDVKAVLEVLDNLLSGSIDIKRLTFDLIDVLKDVIIYKNTEDVDVLFVLNKADVDSIVPYITVEDCFDMIDTLVETSSNYNRANNARIYFELAILKICNHIKEEKVINVQENVQVITNNDVTKNEEPVKEKVVKQEQVEKEVKKEETIEANNTTQEFIENKSDDTSIDTENNKDENSVENIVDDSSNKEVVEVNDIEVDFNDILMILVQAKRTVLNDIKEHWEIIKRYRFNLNTAKFANMLCDGEPVAAGEKGFIIAFKYKPQVNAVNSTSNYYHLKNFLKDVLGNEYDFIAININDWQDYRNKFIQLKKTNQLPQPGAIQLHHIGEFKEDTKQLNDAQQMAIDMFGEDIVEIEE